MRYQSKTAPSDWPLISIAMGPDAATRQPRGIARGILAIGDIATGAIAIGALAIGYYSTGGLSIGVHPQGGALIEAPFR